VRIIPGCAALESKARNCVKHYARTGRLQAGKARWNSVSLLEHCFTLKLYYIDSELSRAFSGKFFPEWECWHTVGRQKALRIGRAENRFPEHDSSLQNLTF
jgi:hypothetical protein